MPHTQIRRALHLAAIICVALLVVANMMLIFGFSSESREESGSRSQEVTEMVAPVVKPDYPEMSPTEQQAVVEHLHHYVRKAAHFLEYALLGCLTASLLCLLVSYFGRNLAPWLSLTIPAAYCLLCAAADETYQIFTNRGPSVKDVLIDFCGAVCGTLFLHLCVWLIRAIRRHSRKEAASV